MITTQQTIEFQFEAARPKLQNLFPFDPKCDIEILFRNNKYQLQIAFLRRESGFFKNFNPNHKFIKIQEDFNKDYFEEIMKCFYGGTFKCPRSAVSDVWRILCFLKIESFQKHIIEDMKINFSKYKFFELLTFSYMSNLEEIFNKCLAVLDSQNFIQLKKNKEQFFACPLQVFRFPINMNNRRLKEGKQALSYMQINKLISEYSERCDYSDEFCKELKFQLIEKTALTSEEYKIIFLDGVKSQSTREISDYHQTNPNGFKKTEHNPILAESAQITSTTKKQMKIEQKQHWNYKLQALKLCFSNNENDYKKLLESVGHISKSIHKRSQQSKSKQLNLSKMQLLVRQIEKSIGQNNDSLKRLNQRVSKLQHSGKNKSKYQKQLIPQQQQKDQFVQSHIIPGFVLGDMISQAQSQKKELTVSTANFSKKKKQVYQQQKQPSVDYSYRNSLFFDKQPMSIPKKYLSNLARIMDTDQFMKKKQLNLIFRRSARNGSLGDPAAIKNRNALLFLIETKSKKYLGGYVSVEIPSYSKHDTILCDYQSYIFSLTNNMKSPIRKGEQKEALSLPKDYLISFATDLMISTDLKDNYCQWPVKYEVPKNTKCTTSKQLAGQSPFEIQQIQVYEVKNQDIQMVLSIY